MDSRFRSLLFKRSVAFVAVARSSVLACASTITWVGEAGDGLWHTSGNWSGNSVPGAKDDGVVPGGGDTVEIRDSATVAGGRDVMISSRVARAVRIES